jgi:hypothetical protein
VANSRTEIIQKFISLIDGRDPAWLWFVGISADAKRYLVQAHNVRLGSDPWYVGKASTMEEARSIQTYIRGRYGLDGDPAYGLEPGREVYAFRKDAHTHPDG